MYDYLCSCLPLSRQVVRNGVNRIMQYLNSNSMNQQILEEERCVEEYESRRASGEKLEVSSHLKHYEQLNKDEEEHSEEQSPDDEEVELEEPDPSTMPRE